MSTYITYIKYMHTRTYTRQIFNAYFSKENNVTQNLKKTKFHKKAMCMHVYHLRKHASTHES